MYLAVPTKRFALRELEEKLADAALLPRLMTSMARGDVNIQLPRFRIEQRHDLKNSLKVSLDSHLLSCLIRCSSFHGDRCRLSPICGS